MDGRNRKKTKPQSDNERERKGATASSPLPCSEGGPGELEFVRFMPMGVKGKFIALTPLCEPHSLLTSTATSLLRSTATKL